MAAISSFMYARVRVEGLAPVWRTRILWVVWLAIGAAALCLGLLAAHAPTYRAEVHVTHTYGTAGYGAPVPLSARFPFRLSTDGVDGKASNLQLYEDGRPLGPPHAPHAQIFEVGGGAYSHWVDGFLYFSASDNSDPRQNGRHYTVEQRAELAHRVLGSGMALVLGLLLLARRLEAAAHVKASHRLTNWVLGGIAAVVVAQVFADVTATNHGTPVLVPDSVSYFDAKALRPPLYRLLAEIPQSLAPDNSLFVAFQAAALLLGLAALGWSAGVLACSFFVGAILVLLLASDASVLAYAHFVLAESWFATFVALHLAAALYTLRTRRLRGLAVASLFAGLAVLTRPVGASLLVGLAILVLLVRTGPWLRAAAAAGMPALVVLALGAAPNPFEAQQHASGGVAGQALLSNVLTLAKPDTRTPYPELYARILARTSLLVQGREAAYPHEDWLARMKQLNALYYGYVLPEIQAYIGPRVPRAENDAAVNAAALALALAIIRDDPLGYVRLAAANLYGMWFLTFSPYNPLENFLSEEAARSREIYGGSKELQQAFAPPEPPARAGTLTLTDRLAAAVRAALRACLPLWIAVTGIAATGWLVTVRSAQRRPALIAGVQFSALQLWGYYLLVALFQPAILRYVVVFEPVLLTCIALSLAAAVSSLVALPLRATEFLRTTAPRPAPSRGHAESRASPVKESTVAG